MVVVPRSDGVDKRIPLTLAAMLAVFVRQTNSAE